MKPRLELNTKLSGMNGPGFYDHQVMAEILLDIRDLMLIGKGLDPNSTNLTALVENLVKSSQAQSIKPPPVKKPAEEKPEEKLI